MNISVVFCDIYGCIDGEVNEYELIRFSNLLESIRLKDKSDYIFFKISSTESNEVIENYLNLFKKYFNEFVIIPEISYLEDLKDKKVTYSYNYIKHLNKEYNINNIYYIDDTKLIHYMLGLLIDKPINSIIPTKNTLNCVNNNLQELIFSFTKQK